MRFYVWLGVKWISFFLLVLVGYLFVRPKFGNRKKDNPDSAYLARVSDCFLYQDDLFALGLGTPAVRGENGRNDGLLHYVQNWACNRLLVMQANKYIDVNDEKQQLSQYQDDLLAHTVLSRLIDQQLDTSVSDAQVVDFYQKHKHELLLGQDIVKGVFLSIPRGVLGVGAVKSWMLSGCSMDIDKLQSFCKKNARAFVLEPNQWLAWEDVLRQIRFTHKNHAKLLQKNKLIHFSDARSIFLLKIDDYKLVGEIAPCSVVEKKIRAIVLHKRKLALEKKIKNKLLQDAKKNNIYTTQLA